MPPDAAVDHRWMRRALALAGRGAGQVSPNPLVGCVLVRDGERVSEGWHRVYGGPHAEVDALRTAGDRARGATAYVTLEPCNHWGKTPPCTDALIAAGVARVVVAARDPFPAAAGGAERLRAAGVAVDVGVRDDEAREQNAAFLFAVLGAARPWVTLKLAVSLEGAVADHTRGPGWLTGPASRRAVHRLRAAHDAVAVGIGTALADDPALTVRDVPPPRVPPLRVVFDRAARLPLGSHLVRTAGEAPVVVACAADAPAGRVAALERAGVRIVQAAGLDEALAAVRRDHGVRALFAEGGARLSGALWGAGVVDRLVIFQAPVVLGTGAVIAFEGAPAVRATEARRLPVVGARWHGADRMTVYAVHAAPGGPPPA
jgi:diaminohydroxyphosphoribosylaminopyrimidine deaminase/5-amino-6-(5-phosphoribosylamino)uracil reductase